MHCNAQGRDMRYNWIGSRAIDYTLGILDILKDGMAMNQGDLTEAIWGTSGRGNSTLTTVLFPYMVRQGYMTLHGKRPKLFVITEKGRQVLADHGPRPE
jgi:hypothetical protein